MNDYYIDTDENGNHYLCHGIDWKNHKYIKKIGEGKLARYFYTPEELKAYLHAVATRMQQTGETAKDAGAKVAATMQTGANTAKSVASGTAIKVSDTAKAVAQKVQEKAAVNMPNKAVTRTNVDNRQGDSERNIQSVIKDVSEQLRAAKESAKKATQVTFEAAKKTMAQAEKAIGAFREKTADLLQKYDKKSSQPTIPMHMEPVSSTESDQTANQESGKRPTAHQKRVEGTAKEGWSKRRESEAVSNQNGKNNPVSDLEAAATALLDPDIKVDTSLDPIYQILHYSDAVNEKYAALKETDYTAAQQYQKEQVFVIGAMACSQYYRMKELYEGANNHLVEIQQEINTAQKDYDDALAAYKKNKSSLSKEERKVAQEQLTWKKDVIARTKQNGKEQALVISGYYSEMKGYKDLVDACSEELEHTQFIQAASQPSITPNAPLHIDPNPKPKR